MLSLRASLPHGSPLRSLPCWCWLALLALSLSPARAAAQAIPLRIDASAERMRVDGALKEWKGARFTELGEGDDASLRFALATADDGLYVGIELRDERLVSGDKGDSVVITLQMPDADDWLTSELVLLPGQAGKTAARGLLGFGGRAPKPEPRMQVVEGPREEGAGYVIEAFVPWSLVRGAEIWEQGRGNLRFADVDDTRVELTIMTARSVSGALPRLVLGEGQRDLLGSFAQQRRMIGVEPRYDFRANVSGDAQPERIAILDRYVVVYGPGYLRGETYNYFALPYSVGGGLIDAHLVDLTGDGRAELVTRLHQQNTLGTRDLWLALALAEDSMSPLFTVETKRELKGGYIDSTLTLGPAEPGKARRIEVKAGRALGLDASTYREPPATDAEPLLLPWGEVEQRSFVFDGKRFAVVEEKRRPVPLRVPTPLAARVDAQALSSAPSALAQPGGGAGSSDLLALFKTQAKLPRDATPTRALRANVLGGDAAEQIDVFGSTLVLTGPDVGGGRSYITYAAPVSDARDLLDVRSGDVTGDGVHELLLRVRQRLAGGDGVERELLLVLRADASARLARVLLVEVARRQRPQPPAGKQPESGPERAVENRVLVQRGALTIEPGEARGWSGESYPFSLDAIAGSERLLLPWMDRPVVYRLAASALVPVR
jgi:hypothetical protein